MSGLNPMLRDETETLIRRYYQKFNAHDTMGMLGCLADDIVHDVNQGERRKGKSMFATFMEHMNRCYREHLDDIVVMSNADGTHAAAEFVVHGKYLATDEGLPPASGQTYKLPAGAFFTVEGGVITRVSTYYNLKDWMAQVVG
jgi:steroid delta-isomerase-like uncharacterized protein